MRSNCLPCILLVLCCAACDRPYYPPPPQRTLGKHTVAMLLDLTGGCPPEAWGAIVSGIHSTYDPRADWRWAGEQSTFTYQLDDYTGWNLAAHLTAAQAVLDKTGPQTVTFEVNGRPVGAATLGTSRRYDLTFPVTPDLLRSAVPVTVRMTAAPCVPADTGPPFCVLLHSIGFAREPR